MSFRGPSRLRWHRPFDLFVAIVGGTLSTPLWVGAMAASAVSTRSNGIFAQTRIGRAGQPFTIYKIRTMTVGAQGSSVTTASDARITPAGSIIRRLKFDELPQLHNVLRGEMGLIGPRPDVPGFADELTGDDARVLTVRPGITGAASVLMRDEERLLQASSDPERFNADTLYPAKTRLNLAWIDHGSLLDDVRLAIWTVLPPPADTLVRFFERWDPTLRDWDEMQRMHEIQSSGV